MDEQGPQARGELQCTNDVAAEHPALPLLPDERVRQTVEQDWQHDLHVDVGESSPAPLGRKEVAARNVDERAERLERALEYHALHRRPNRSMCAGFGSAASASNSDPEEPA